METFKALGIDLNFFWIDIFYKDLLLDVNGDGMVQKDEILKILKEPGFSIQETEALFKSVDVNSDGKISVQEFLAGFQKSQ
jgi:Ca2+-binding EF-hand superfamily protein